MNAPSVDIKDILKDEASLSLTFGTNLFVSDQPEEPDLCVAVYDGPGEDPESNYDYGKPHVQVRVRGARNGYVAAYTLMKKIYDRLHGATDETVNSTRYIGIFAIGDISYVGRDEGARRPLLTANFRIHRAAA